MIGIINIDPVLGRFESTIRFLLLSVVFEFVVLLYLTLYVFVVESIWISSISLPPDSFSVESSISTIGIFFDKTLKFLYFS